MNVQFAFADETGITKDPNQPYFGVGALIVHDRHIELNRRLRTVFLKAVHELEAVEERFEFKFTYIKPASLKFYEEILNILEQHTENWEFIAELQKRKQKSFWKQYLSLLKRIFKSGQTRTFLLADYLDKPKRDEQELSDVTSESTSIIGVMQLESQGTVLLQAADILLGALAFSKRKGKKDRYKEQIAERVLELLKQKEEPL